MADDDIASPPTPAQVADRIRSLKALEESDPTAFAEALADNIVEPEAVDTQAFRSNDLAFQALAAADYLVQRSTEQVARFRRDSVRQRGVMQFRAKVARERRLLENITTGIKATQGILPAAPNPRRRAKERLWSEAMKGGPIPAGRWRRLLDEEIQRDKDKKADAKRARRQRRTET